MIVTAGDWLEEVTVKAVSTVHLYLTILTMVSRALVSMMLILLLQPIYADSVLQMKSEISLSTMLLELLENCICL